MAVDYGIYVDLQKPDVIDELDRYFRIGRKRDIFKEFRVEVDSSVIANFSHFIIMPQTVDPYKEVMLDLPMRTCKVWRRAWGTDLTSPVTIKRRYLKPLLFAVIERSFRMDTELIVESRLRSLFDAAGVTGLKYSSCELYRAERQDQSSQSPAYLAEIAHGTYQCGSHIVRDDSYCRKHSTITVSTVFDLRTPREALTDDDFLMLNEYRVKRKVYRRCRPPWVVTRKVLEILLKYKIWGLHQQTVFLKQKFRPLIISES